MIHTTVKIENPETFEDRIQRHLTPDSKEQVVRVLSGKCPHNGDWNFHGYYHNGKVYRCSKCGELKFY